MWTLVSRSTTSGIQKYELKPGRTTMGRGSSNEIDIPDILASRNHCEIVLDPKADQAVLHDLDSKNGTFLNGKLVEEPRQLEAEDQIRIGHALFEVIYQEDKRPTSVADFGLQTRALTTELVLHSINRHTVLLNEIAEHLNTVSDMNTAIRLVANLAKKVLGADRCLVVMAQDFGKLEDYDLPSTITKPAIEDHLIILKQSSESEGGMGKTATLQGVHSAICVPVVIKDELVAIFYMDRALETPTPFADIDLELAVGISHQMALSIQRKEIEEELLHNALYDSLTGLPNRSLFTDELKKRMAEIDKKSGSSCAVIRFDLDDFRVVNDFFGYSTGDDLLIKLAQRLREFLKLDEIAARLGGDEFAILVMNVKDDKVAMKAASDLHKMLTHPFELGDRQVRVTAGVGISLTALEYDDPVDLLRDAETAMYRAKEQGRGQTAVYDKHMRDMTVARINLESRLSQAIEKKEFRVRYQPIVSLGESTIIGFEAFVRWQQTAELQLTATDFISLAEKTPYIFDIDMLVLRTACLQFKEWQKQYEDGKPLWVSTNLSGRHVGDENFIPRLQQVLEETGIPPHSLNLEFTEKTLIGENSNTVGLLNKLRDFGVRVSIDDFGVGYSSLSYLRHLPVDYLKIDRSFVLHGDWDIAAMVTDLAHKLKLEVIAEGVETRDQLTRLNQMGCDYVQGNYISQAIDVEGVGKLIRKTASLKSGSLKAGAPDA